MSRFSSLLRRIFGGTGRIIKEVYAEVLNPSLRAILNSGAKSDAERREIVKEHVSDYIATKFPEYGWLADRITDVVFDTVRRRLK